MLGGQGKLSSTKHKLVADVTVIAQDKTLLTKYKDLEYYDGQAGWFIPDDYLEHLEHPEKGARRILKEQLDLTVPVVTLGFIESFEGNGFWHLVFHYKANLDAIPRVTPGENVKEARWFPVSNLPDRKEMAHSGWGLGIILRLTKGGSHGAEYLADSE